MLCRIVAVVGLMAAVGAADAQAATTRYVATPAHGGSDAGSNNCATSSSPCATIRQAVTKAASGDTIKIGPGDFPEAVSATTKALTFLGAGSGTQTDFNSATQTEIDASTLNKIALTFGSKNETIEGLRVAGGQHTNNYQALSDPGASTPPTLTVSHCVLLQGTVVPNGSVEGPVANLGGSGTGVTASFVDSVAVGIINAVVDLASVGSLTAEHSLFSGGIGNSHPDITFTASALDTAVNTTVVGSVLRASSALITNAKSTTVLRSNIEASGAGVILNDGGNAPMLAMRDSIIGPGAGTLTEGVLVVPNGADTEVPSVNLTFDTVLARQNGQALALDVSQADLGTHVNTENTILRSIDTSGGSGNDDIATGTQALNWNINYTDYTQTSGVGVPVPGSGTNFDVQPHFVDDDGSNLRLSSTSTLFDKGNPAAVNQGETDITGAPRSLAHTCGGAALPDVGAFEAPAPGSCPPPTATLTTPANGATYTQGQSVKAAYSCGAPPAPATLAACVGAAADGTAVANGAAIDTSTPGSYTFTVTATANDGATAAATATYTVKAPPPPKPSLGAIKVSHKTFAAGGKVATIAKAKHKKKPPVGTTFSFKLNTAATLKLAFAKVTAGRKAKVKHKTKCVAPTAHNRHGRSCKLSKAEGKITLAGHAGTDKITFQGRVSKSHKLGPATYTVTITASGPGGESRSRTATFTIVR